MNARPDSGDDEPFRFKDGIPQEPLQIIDRFARSQGQSWSHFENAREEARRYMAYLREGPADPELRSVWEANGWNLDRRPSRVLLWNPRTKFHMRPRAWLWALIEDATEWLHEAATEHRERAETEATQ